MVGRKERRMPPSARLTAVRIEAEGMSAAAVEQLLVTAGRLFTEAIGGEAAYGEQFIEMDHLAMSVGAGDELHTSSGTHKGRAKLWPDIQAGASQYVALGLSDDD
jgi:hypothetical protein